MKRAIPWSLTAIAFGAMLTELAYWRAGPESVSPGRGSCVVLVLGYPSEPDGTPHPVQRFRVETGVAVYREHRCSKIVFSGGAIRNRHVEAETMAAIAASLGVAKGDVILERRARTTWENVGCSTPLLRGANRVFLVSDSLHAQRAKRYACRQDSDLCPAVSAAGADPPLALLWWKVPAALREFGTAIRDSLVYESGLARDAPLCSRDGPL
jgi:vancomycin permeability regulator SanA